MSCCQAETVLIPVHVIAIKSFISSYKYPALPLRQILLLYRYLGCRVLGTLKPI